MKTSNELPDSTTKLPDERVLASVSSEELYKLLTKDINDWGFSRFTTDHHPTGYEFWTCNGLICFKVHEKQKIGLNWIDTIRLWFWLKNARRVQVAQRIYEYGC